MVGGLPRYWRTTLAELRAFRPELVLAGSDAPHTILARQFARRLGVPYVIDLYDNYESFGLTQVPGMRWLYRRALRAAAGIAAVSAPLAEYVQSLAPGVPVLTLESTVDPARFFPRERGEARARLKLPAAGRLVGVSGSLNRNRGIDQVYASFLRLSAGDPRLFLVLAGDADPRMPPPAHPRVLRLGRIPHEAMPLFFSALDLALVPMIDTAFGRHAFPQKAYEILACRVPLLTARVGALARTLAPWPQCLYAPDDAAALDLGIRQQLERPVRPEVPIPSWDEQAGRLEDFVRRRLADDDARRRVVGTIKHTSGFIGRP